MRHSVGGLDAGGSATRAVVACPSTGRVGWGRAGGANPNHYGWKGAAANMLAALKAACVEAGVPETEIGSLFCGVAGVISQEDRDAVVAQCRNWELGQECLVAADHDIRVALQGGLSGRAGIALIAGTGSSCYGRNALGESWQAGGWDQLLDDLGSGYCLARNAMAAACQSADGRLPHTRLQDLLFEKLGARDAIDFCVKVHRPAMPRHAIAALAPFVIEAAEMGDEAAIRIMHDGARELSRMVDAVTRRIFPQCPPDIVLIGGLLEKSSAYRQEVERAIVKHVPSSRFHSVEMRPAVGAWMLAAAQAGVSFDRSMLTKISEYAKD